jgi:L-lactate dehydrogenase complex protein LldE
MDGGTANDTRKDGDARRPMLVGLLPTCLVDLFRPEVGFAAADLIVRGGARVDVPPGLTCCGQPAYNSGDRPAAQVLARQVIAALEGFDHVVAPSGSCAGMVKVHYPDLLADDPPWHRRAVALSARTHELVSFLVDVLGLEDLGARFARKVAYHDSCSSLREMKVRDQPRRLLGRVEGLDLVEVQRPESCCGFGGTFCVKYPEISNRMVSDKVADVVASGAEVLLAGDLGCLLNIAGRMSRLGHAVEVRHVAEVLAGRADGPPITPRR